MIALLIFGWIFLGVADALAFDKLIRLEHSRYRTNDGMKRTRIKQAFHHRGSVRADDV
ncbi:MAG: hypothetical protein M3R15_20905 [Acidobacteriota bacterium]|nr:hypothetical protein [Acidobacteriota bacterium]